MYYLFLIIAVLLNASANILMKVGAIRAGTMAMADAGSSLIRLATNPFLISGVGLFTLNIIFYFLALTKLNISIAYPIMTSVGFLIISVFSVFYLKENLTHLQILGIITIVIGISLIAYDLK